MNLFWEQILDLTLSVSGFYLPGTLIERIDGILLTGDIG
jgi:hypothetical protein